MSGFMSISRLTHYCLAGIAVLAVSAMAQTPPAIIEISSPLDLASIGKSPDYPLDGHYVLMNDIHLPIEEVGLWTPIGRSEVKRNETELCLPYSGPGGCGWPFEQNLLHWLHGGAFRGTFDGQGYAIKGLNIRLNHPTPLSDASHQLQPTFLASAGLFGSLNGATIKNLTIEADSVVVGGTYSGAGGILAGYSRNSVITNSRVKGTVHADFYSHMGTHHDYINIGGLVGKSMQDSITNSSAEVTVSASLKTLVPSFFPVILDGNVGGLVGTSELTFISGCNAVTAISDGGYGNSIGGLVGDNYGGTITKSGARVRTEPTTNFTDGVQGAFVHFVNIGGLAGINRGHSMCPIDEVVDCFHPGFFGTITQSYAAVDLKGSIGVASSGKKGNIGGLVGAVTDHGSVISDCYTRGTIITNDNQSIVGGFLGHLEYPMDMSVTRSYAAVSIAGNAASKGGFAGQEVELIPSVNILLPTFFACYWDIEVSEITNGGINLGVIGKTTEEMYQKNTFVGEVEVRAWDFDNVWRIKEGEGYPYLAWQDGLESTSISNRQITRGANRNNFAPTVTVRGKTLNVRTLSSTQNLQVRLIDMRGRTMTRFDMTGGGNISLNKISAGRYIVDMRDMETGRRFSSPIVVR